MKKIVTLFTAVLLTLQAAFPAFAVRQLRTEYAQSTGTVDFEVAEKVRTKGSYENLVYEITGDEVTVTGFENQPTGELKIPETIEGKTVTTIADNAFRFCDEISALTAPSVRTIGKHAFYRCGSLASVSIPKAETLSDYCFHSCGAIKSIDMPGVTTVGTGAFMGDDAVEMQITSAVMPSVSLIKKYAFAWCDELTEIKMPNVQTIEPQAFRGCTKLTSIEIAPENEYFTSEGAVIYNKEKTAIIAYPSASGDFETDVQTIAEGAFVSCNGLTSIKMPEVTSVGDFAFFTCHNLSEVEMPKLTEAGGYSFMYTPWYEKLTDEFAVFGDGVLIKYTGTDSEVTIPENVKYVAGFCENDRIMSVDMPSVQTVGDNAFCYCSVESVSMPAVQKIGKYAFGNCRITEVELYNVSEIDDIAFSFSRNLEKAYFYADAPTHFGEGVFDNCAEGFTIFYAKGTQGFTSPEWNGYNAVEFEPDTQPTDEPLRMTGDLNADGIVNTADAVVVLKASANMILLDEVQLKIGDVNHDDTVNTADAVLILKYAAGMIDKF